MPKRDRSGQRPRERAAYFAAYHEARKAARNAARRARYAATRSRAARSAWKRRRTAEVEALGMSDRKAAYATVAGSVELSRLVAAQEADDRRIQVKFGPSFEDRGDGIRRSRRAA